MQVILNSNMMHRGDPWQPWRNRAIRQKFERGPCRDSGRPQPGEGERLLAQQCQALIFRHHD